MAVSLGAGRPRNGLTAFATAGHVSIIDGETLGIGIPEPLGDDPRLIKRVRDKEDGLLKGAATLRCEHVERRCLERFAGEYSGGGSAVIVEKERVYLGKQCTVPGVRKRERDGLAVAGGAETVDLWLEGLDEPRERLFLIGRVGRAVWGVRH